MFPLEERYKLFAANAAAVAAEVFRARTEDEAGMLVKKYVRSLHPRYAAWVESPLLEKINFPKLMESEGVQLWSEGLTVEQAARADLGVLVMDVAIAETGTVAHDATRLESRLVTTLPPACLVLVPTNSILSTLPEVLEYAEKRWIPPAGFLALITGPSRSADIERVLTTGVHGPERLAILCCDWMDFEGVGQDECKRRF
ncbi:MAG: LutC/YkgG family protein [Bacillota bacterium]